jgi:CheY-like chemotaxis protein
MAVTRPDRQAVIWAAVEQDEGVRDRRLDTIYQRVLREHSSMSLHPRVLIALQHDDSRQLYAEYLGQLGFSVASVRDGRSALGLVPTADVVVTSLVLPLLDGASLIRAVRASESTRHKTVIVVAASVFPSDRARAEEAGCDVFLAMPCSPDELRKEIESAAYAVRRTPLDCSAQATSR